MLPPHSPSHRRSGRIGSPRCADVSAWRPTTGCSTPPAELAVANLKGNFGFTDNCGDVVACNGPGGPNAFEAASVSKLRFGYAVGGGVEAGLWSNWSLKAEYLYVGFRSESVVGFITTPGIAPFAVNNPFTHTVDLKAHIARLGLNYRLGGPVTARY